MRQKSFNQAMQMDITTFYNCAFSEIVCSLETIEH